MDGLIDSVDGDHSSMKFDLIKLIEEEKNWLRYDNPRPTEALILYAFIEQCNEENPLHAAIWSGTGLEPERYTSLTPPFLTLIGGTPKTQRAFIGVVSEFFQPEFSFCATVDELPNYIDTIKKMGKMFVLFTTPQYLQALTSGLLADHIIEENQEITSSLASCWRIKC